MTIIYQEYDQEALDAQYNLRPLVPHHPKIFERYIRDSAIVVEKFPCTLDIAYGAQPGERLDVFRAFNPAESSPVVVFIHGGYWRSKDKSDYRYLAPAFVSAGITFVLLNYTLAPDATIDEIVRQNRAGVAWLYAHIAEYGGDPDRIHITGHSAGGHLVGMLMATSFSEFTDGVINGNPIRSGTAISGLFDLEPISLSYLNETLQIDPDSARRNSPQYLTPAEDIPLILSLGGNETVEYHRQQRSFELEWRQHLSTVNVIDMPGLNHYDVIDHFGHPGSALHQAVIGQVSLNN